VTGLIVGLGLGLYLPGLAAESLRSPLEVMYAFIAREMLHGQSPLLVPHLFGVLYPDKPPLYFWATAGLGWLAGTDIGEWTARLPAALAAVAGLLLVYRLGADLFTPRAGVVSACVLATSNLFFWYARQGHPDQFLTTFVTLAGLGWWRSLAARDASPRAGWTALASVAMGLGVLSKGLLALVLPLLAVLGFLLLTGPRQAILERLHVRLSLPVFAAVVLAWYAPAVATYGRGYLVETLVHQQLTRYARGWVHVEPWYYYAGQLPVGFFPWALFLPSAIVLAWRARRRPGSPDLAAADPAASNPQAVVFPLSWLLIGIVFLSLSTTKRGAYLLPLYPAAALLVGWLWTREPTGRASWRWIGIPLGVLSTGLSGLALALGVVPHEALLRHLDPASHVSTFVPANPWQLRGVVLLILAGAVGVWGAWRRRPAAAVGLLIAIQAVVLLTVAMLRAPQYEAAFPIRRLAAQTDRLVPPGRPLLTTLRQHSVLAVFYCRHRVTLYAGAAQLLASRRTATEPRYALVDGDEAILAQPGVETLVMTPFGGNRRIALIRVDPQGP
jgi:4-amino-4-deoxy-L-arabinose transferase-like glycosyltransferase